MPDLGGAIVGILSVLALVALYRYSEHLSDGNIDAVKEDEE